MFLMIPEQNKNVMKSWNKFFHKMVIFEHWLSFGVEYN